MKVIPLFFCLVAIAYSAPEPVESIIAVVDGKAILRSDLLEAQSQAGAGTSPEVVLASLIDDKVLLARAERDSMMASPEEIRMRVDSHMQMLMARQGINYQTLEKAVRQQMGISMAQFREQIGKQISQQVLMGKLRQRYIGPIEPTRQEVEKFYQVYKDSLPPQMNSIRVSHLQINIAPSVARVDSVRIFAEALIDSLEKGVAFEVLAGHHSQDSAASKGGNLGYFRKGILEPEYERAAWKLDLGQFTEKPVRTRLGWHIIRILGKKDDQLQTAQILLRIPASATDSLQAHQRIDSLRTATQGGANFSELAKKFSDDQETAWIGGNLGWMERADVDTAYAKAISTLQEGEVGMPVQFDGAWHLFRLDKAEPKARKLTLVDDFLQIQEFAINQLTNEKLKKLVEKWRKEILIDIRQK